MYKRAFILVLAAITVLTGCGVKKPAEPADIQFEHVVQKQPDPTAAPTDPPKAEGDPDALQEAGEVEVPKGDPEGLGGKDPVEDGRGSEIQGIFEIDGMRFTPVNDTVRVIAGSGANLREGPSTDYPKVVLSRAGDTFTRTAVGDGAWDQLLYQGEAVYIRNDFIEKVDANKADASESYVLPAYQNGGRMRTQGI